jgi:hypothetical protein
MCLGHTGTGEPQGLLGAGQGAPVPAIVLMTIRLLTGTGLKHL